MLRRRHVLPLTAVFGLTLLPGCPELLGLLCDFETDETCEDPSRAQVLGTIEIPQAGGASVGVRPPTSDAQRTIRQAFVDAVQAKKAKTPIDVDSRRRALKRVPFDSSVVKKEVTERWREGEIIVRSTTPIRGRKAEVSRELELFLGDRFDVDVRLCGTEYRCLADVRTLDGKKTDLETTRRLAERLNAMPSLKYAEKNLLLDKTAFPSDEFFTFQWHYAAIDVPAAWDITQGDDSVVAAVIDTGILLDHPDLGSRVIGGADLIDDPGIANDGDGRDDDGNDDGDNSCGGGCHSYHGTHCAGTMGADTDNGLMVSGIAWRGGLLAVRVLGQGGGTLNDIADGIEWSVGNSVDGVSNNSRPADVLNLSLGGGGESAVMNESIRSAIDAGAIVVVAAGNDDSDASGFTPANSPGAITVSALGYNFGGTPTKASYSNFGNDVDVAAPGGEQREDSDGDGNGDGVLSTIGDFVGFSQGTSMAAPHVAGVAMLMKAQNPNLTQDQARDILKDTADADINCPDGCGAGQINAFAAVVAAGGGDIEGLSAASVRVGAGVTTASIVVRNFGSSAVNADFTVGGADRDAVSISPSSASIPGGGKVSVTATIARADGADDVGQASVRATGGGDTAEARLDWTADKGAVVEVVTVGAVRLNDDGGFSVVTDRLVETNVIKGFSYKLFNMDPGEYLIIALLDGNNDGDFDDPEDATGFYSATVSEDGNVCTGNGCNSLTLSAGDRFEGIDFLTAPGFNGGDDVGGNGDGRVGDACGSSSDCGSGLFCESGFDGGYCTADCVDVASDCPAGSTCFDVGGGDQICFDDCDDDSDCTRGGYVCDVIDGIGSCIPE
jgi:serine protease